MAKLKYNKPIFSICPIPLAVGSSGSCVITSENAPYTCPVMTEFGYTVFSSEECQMKTQENDSIYCYVAMDADYTVFTS